MICQYCKQLIIEKDYFTEEEDEIIQLVCDCPEANKKDSDAKRELALKTREYIKGMK